MTGAVAALALASWPAAAGVISAGDVSPSFGPAPTVDLTGQRVFLGSTIGAVGTLGTIDVTAGGVLTAAQIVPGVGGLGVGIVTVSGAGSLIRLTGGGAFNGLDIGSWGTGTVTVANGGAITCSSPLACPFNGIGNAAGSNGTLAINGGSVTGLGTLTVGQGTLQAGFGTPGANTSGTLSLAAGGVLATTGTSSVASNSGQTGLVTGNVTIDGAGSAWSITRDLANGGGQAFLRLAPTANSDANVTIGNGGNLTVSGSRSNPATDSSLPGIGMSTAAGATSTMTVTTGGSVRIGGDSGVLNVGGNSAANSAGANATLNINGGGTVSGTGTNGLLFMAIGQNLGTGTVNVSGAGSQLVVAGVGGPNTQGLDGLGGLIMVGRDHGNGGGSGALNVSAGGSVLISDNGQAASTGSMGLRLANGSGSSGAVTVSGSGSSIVISSTGGAATTPSVEIGNGGIGQMTIGNGALVSVQGTGQRNFIVGNSSIGSGSLGMTNGSSMNASWFAIGNNGGSGVATIDASTVNVGGVVFFNATPIGAGVRVGRGVGADGTLNLQNGAVINIDNSIENSSVILGGTSSLAGGTGTLNMSGGSSINFTGSAASASLQVGGVGGTGFMTMNGSSVDVGATGNVRVGATAGSAGTLTIGAGSVVSANSFGIGGNSDTVAGGNGTATVTGPASQLRASGDTGFVGVGRSGTGSLVVSNQATLAAIIVNVGRADGSVGTLSVDNATVTLAGEQVGGTGAGLSIGNRGGNGAVTVQNASQVTLTNMGAGGTGLNIGGTPTNPLGTGTLVVSGGSQISLVAAPGLATVRVGHDGTGSATFTGSALNVGDGSVIIAGLPGSTGTLSLNAGSVVNAGYVGVGATPNGPGGAGRLILNDSTINTTTFEIGPSGILSGDGGTLHATGDVIVAGTISPGNSPGRIVIHCNIISLDGSMLIMDVLAAGPGYDIDRLIIGNGSTFDLSHLQIVFNFLGDTDPNLFAESGGFDLDNFLRSGLDTGDVGLSAAFAPGQTWSDVVDPSRISAVSNVFDVTDLQLRGDGSFAVTTAAIPEPSTWVAMLLGLACLCGWARRRAISA